MRIVSLDESYYREFGDDPEMLLKHNRPCVLVLKLRFRGQKHDFAVPLRSNIAPNVPKSQYFALPPRPTTKPKHRHGIHYLKMMPVRKCYLRRFRTEGNPYYETIRAIIDENARQIVIGCQQYLDDYECNGRPRFGVDIDKILRMMELAS